MATSDAPQGKSMRELRAIVAADNRRFDQLAEEWGGLTEAEQNSLIEQAREMNEGKNDA